MDFEQMWPDDMSPTPVELLLRDPARKGWPTALPGGAEERRRLDEVPAELCVEVRRSFGGWCTELELRRGRLREVYGLLYGGEDLGELPGLNGDPDDLVGLIGFWD